MEISVYFIAGVIIGGIIAWFIASGILQRKYAGLEGRAGSAEAIAGERNRQIQQKEEEAERLRNELNLEKQYKVEAFTRLEASQKNLEEQRLLLESMKKEMTDTFNALSAAALKSSSEDFLRLASTHLGTIIETTKGKLGEHQAG